MKTELNKYGGTPEEILALLNEKDDRITELESLLTDMNEYDIGEVLPTSIIERFEKLLRSCK